MLELKDDTLVFLDVDGVLNAYNTKSHGQLDPDLVEELNTLLNSWGRPKVVMNTAWNIRPLEEVREELVATGFKYPDLLVDQTGSTAGGGGPVRRYLLDNDLVGTAFIIIDDGTHDYGEMWCRLVVCDGHKGFIEKRRKYASDLIWKARNPNEERDRRLATGHIVEHCHWLAEKATWLSPEERIRYIRAELDIAAHCMTDPLFMERALLVKPTPPEPEG